MDSNPHAIVAPEHLRSKPHGLFTWPAYALGGIFVVLYCGLAREVYHLDWETILWALFWSNVIGFCCILFTIRVQWIPWVHQKILTRGWKTWALFLSLYISGVLWKIPSLRPFPQGVVLFFPLWLTNWIVTPWFGKIQDAWVKWDARKAH